MPPTAPPEEPARVTESALRDAGSGCPRRLALDVEGRAGTAPARARWRLRNAILDDLAAAHRDLAAPRAGDLRPPPHLTPEESAVYDHALGWYADLYAGRPVRFVGPDDRARDLPDLGLRLVGTPGLPVERRDGTRELRLLELGARPGVAGDLLESTRARFSLCRFADRLGAGAVVVSRADLVTGVLAEATIDTSAAAGALGRWLADGVDVLRAHLDGTRPRSGLECVTCRHVASCPALR